MISMNITHFEPLEYQANEAINTLCTNLFFAGGDIKKIMITSCHPQEGKSFISMNLLRSLAGLGLNVVLVDADIRASAIQGVYGVEIEMSGSRKYPGLTSYLAGQCTMNEIVGRTNIPNASLVLAGKTVSNSLPLLNSERMKVLLETLSRNYDVVLVDAPPVGEIIDAARIGSLCDGTLFIVQSGGVSHKEMLAAMQQLERTGCPILGTVLNKYDEHRYGSKYYSKYHRYEYYYRYGHQEDPEKKLLRQRLCGGKKASVEKRAADKKKKSKRT